MLCWCVSFVTAALRKTGFGGLILLRIRFLLVCALLLGFKGGTLRVSAHVHPLSPSLSLSLSFSPHISSFAQLLQQQKIFYTPRNLEHVLCCSSSYSSSSCL